MRGYHGPLPVARDRGLYQDDTACVCGGRIGVKIATLCDPVPGATVYRCNACGRDGRATIGAEVTPAEPLPVPKVRCKYRACQKTIPPRKKGDPSQRQYCDDRCAQRARRARESAMRKALRAISPPVPQFESRICECGCGELFTARLVGGPRRRFAHHKCAKRLAERRRRLRLASAVA